MDDDDLAAGLDEIAWVVTASVVAGAIGISGPSPRVTDERMAVWGAAVRQAAAELSARIGYVPDHNTLLEQD